MVPSSDVWRPIVRNALSAFRHRYAGSGVGVFWFLAVNDAADVSQRHRLMRQVHYLSANPDCLAVGGQMQMIDPEGEPIGLLRPRSQRARVAWRAGNHVGARRLALKALRREPWSAQAFQVLVESLLAFALGSLPASAQQRNLQTR